MLVSLVPVALAAAVLVVPSVLESAAGRVGRGGVLARSCARRPRRSCGCARASWSSAAARRAVWATSAQLAAWALQLLGAFALLLALDLDSHGGIGAAAAVLFAVNVTAVLPATPVERGRLPARGDDGAGRRLRRPAAAALGYGIILQAVEVATASCSACPR